MVDVGKLISVENILSQESHVIYAPNYVRTFNFILRIWSRSHDNGLAICTHDLQ